MIFPQLFCRLYLLSSISLPYDNKIEWDGEKTRHWWVGFIGRGPGTKIRRESVSKRQRMKYAFTKSDIYGSVRTRWNIQSRLCILEWWSQQVQRQGVRSHLMWSFCYERWIMLVHLARSSQRLPWCLDWYTFVMILRLLSF